MFGIFHTNKALRDRVEALELRNQRANKSVREMRDMLIAERIEHKRLQAEAVRTLEMMSRRLVNAGLMRPSMKVSPAVPGQSRITMPTRTIQPGDPIINHGASTSALGDMMLGGLMAQPTQGKG